MEVEPQSRALIEKARTLALSRHHRDNWPHLSWAFLPEHLREVAALVVRSKGSPEQVAAAWLHHILKEQHISPEGLETQVGTKVAGLVHALTPPKMPRGLTLARRFYLEAQRIRHQGREVQLVVLAGIVSDLRCMSERLLMNRDFRECHRLIAGMGQIAAECRGINPELDQEFCAVSAAAYAAHPAKRVRPTPPPKKRG